MRLRIEAEQALLGAVLSDPEAQHGVIELVEPGDMRRPWHSQVLAAMQRLRSRGLLPAATEVYQELQHDHDLPRSVVMDAVPLIGLMEAAPRPEHAAAYAAIVVEAGVRERLRLAGSQIVRAAESGDLEAALSQAVRAYRDVDACATRWSALPERLRGETLVPGAAATAVTRLSVNVRRRDGTVGRNVGQQETCNAPIGEHASAPASLATRAASARALLNLIDDPSQIAAVRRWLQPEHFAPAANGALYAFLRDMHATGKPIDRVTVAWEAARSGLRTDPARLAGGLGPFAVWSARKVYHLGILAQIADAGTAIQSDAADPACSPLQLMRSVSDRLQVLPDEAQLRNELPFTAETAPELCQAAAQTVRQPEREATL